MKVVEKGIFRVVAKVCVDSADCHVHFGHFPGVGIGFLSKDLDVASVSRVLLNGLYGLNEHSARTAARVVNAFSFVN